MPRVGSVRASDVGERALVALEWLKWVMLVLVFVFVFVFVLGLDSELFAFAERRP